MVANGAVALALTYVSGERKGRSGRRPHDLGNVVVIARRPSECGEIVTGKQRRAKIDEAASRNVQVADDVGAEHVVEINRQSLGVIVLGATVIAQAGVERIGWKIQQAKVSKTSEHACFVGDVHVTTGYELGVISSCAGGCDVVADGEVVR